MQHLAQQCRLKMLRNLPPIWQKSSDGEGDLLFPQLFLSNLHSKSERQAAAQASSRLVERIAYAKAGLCEISISKCVCPGHRVTITDSWQGSLTCPADKAWLALVGEQKPVNMMSK